MLVTPCGLTREWAQGHSQALTTFSLPPTPALLPRNAQDSPAFSSKLLKLNCSRPSPSFLRRVGETCLFFKGGPETAMSL